MSDKVIKITCDTKLRIPYDQLHGIQGALKMLSKENFTKLRRRIEKKGIKFSLHVWKQVTKVKSKSEAKRVALQAGGTDEGTSVIKWWIIDGHGRHAVIKWMIEQDGFSCGPLPCVEIEADSFEEAKEEVLASSSNYHTITEDGLYEFMSGAGISIEQLEDFEISEIDMPEFKMNFFDTDPDDDEDEDGPEKKKVEFDAYANAAVKQIVLYYQADTYAKIIEQLDNLAEAEGLEDYSLLILKLVNEKFQTK